MKKSTRKKKEAAIPEITEIKPPIVAEIEHETEEKKGIKKMISSKPFMIGGVVILLIVVAAGVIYGISYFAKDAVNDQTSTQEVQALLEEVGEIVVLPEGETPTIATVTDVEKLSSQPFFKMAQNGDKVIIFGNARQAILYRPSAKKIITMSPIDPNSLPQAQDTEATGSATQGSDNITPTPLEKIKVAVLNSTQEAGLAKKGGDLLDEDLFDIIAALNATGEYEKTTVSVINRALVSDADIKAITNAISNVPVSTASLPSGEAAPAGADVVIILGSDFSAEY
jgi:hypothetical protein